MTLNEAITEGLLVTVIGLIIVFAVLSILMFALMLMKIVFYKEKSKNIDKKQRIDESEIISIPSINENNEDLEIIAVLTAAIAASLNTSTYNLKIKSFKRSNDKASAWNKAGVSEMINTRL